MQNESPLVLVVDDDADFLVVLEAVLASWGYRTLAATSTAAAASILNSQPVDVLLCDLVLADGSGTDLLGPGVRPARAAVVLTGATAHEDVERTRRAGFHAHLVKPVAPETLKRTLDGLLRWVA